MDVREPPICIGRERIVYFYTEIERNRIDVTARYKKRPAADRYLVPAQSQSANVAVSQRRTSST